MFIQADLVPELHGLWAANLDDPRVFHPQLQVWTARAQPWDHMDPALRKFEKEPTAEQVRELLTARS